MQLHKIKELADRIDMIINLVNRAETIEEILAINWALDQYIPLYHKQESWFYAHVLPYEKLLLQPKQELSRLFKQLSIDTNKVVFEEVSRIVKKPSKTSSRKRVTNEYEYLI